MIRFSILFLLTVILTLALIQLFKKRIPHSTPSLEQNRPFPRQRKWMMVVFIECLILYLLFSFTISTAWMKGDDYIFLECANGSLWERLLIIFGRYTNCNGRIGDIIATLLAISENRWQHILLTPLFILALPFTAFRLLSPSHKSIFSAKGSTFILFFIFLLTISVSLTPWRNFWCYAAAVNYIWPLPVICLFLSFFTPERCNSYASKRVIILVFLLGLYSAWSLECITLFLLPGIILWAAYTIKKTKFLSPQCFSGTLGVIWGSFFLLSTPALQRRALREQAFRAFNPDEYDWNQMVDFVLNKSPENLTLLQGNTVPYLFDGIPLPLHVFFLPELMERFLPCCAAGLIVFGILTIHMVIQHSQQWKKHLLLSSSGIIFSMTCASAYLASCIPNDMSFLPPSFIVMLSCSYLFLQSSENKSNVVKMVITIGIIITACTRIIPSVIEAAQYKKYESLRLAEIHRQIDSGEKHIILPPQFDISPKDKLGLITSMDIHDQPTQYPNIIAARCYKVNSITQQKRSESESAR